MSAILRDPSNARFNFNRNYAAGSLGRVLADVCINVAMFPWLVKADNVTDNTAAMLAAVAAGAKRLLLPAGTICISAALVITAPVVLEGQGAHASVIRQTSAGANGIDFAFPSLVQGGGVMDLSVEAGAGWQSAGFQGTGSTGTGIKLRNCNGKFVAERVGVHNFNTGVEVLGCYYSQWEHLEVMYAATAALVLGVNGATECLGNSFRDVKLSNFGFSGVNTASVGLKITQSSGEFFDNIDATTFNTGVHLAPTAATSVRYLFMTKVLGDSSLTTNWLIDATSGGTIIANEFLQCWSSNSQGHGVVFQGVNIDAQKWIGGWIRDSRFDGVRIMGGVNVALLDSEITRNSAAAANTYDGVVIAAGVDSFRIQGCRIGNVSTTVGVGVQRHNINFLGAAYTFAIVGNHLGNPGTGLPINNLPALSSADMVVADNLPKRTVGNNASARIPLSGGTGSTYPAAGSTHYLGPAGAMPSNNEAPFVMVQPGVVAGFYVAVTGAPGASQNYTYTVMKNGVATAMTGSISGAGQFEVSVTTNPFQTLQNDVLTLRLVCSAGAAVAAHRMCIHWEP